MRHSSGSSLCALLCLVVSPIILNADDRDVLKERLHTAVAESSLDTPDVKPWHLLLSFQVTGKDRKPGEAGTIEEWWAAPKLHKTVYTSPSYTNTSIVNEGGAYETSPEISPPEPLTLVLDQILHPLPSTHEVDDSVPQLRKQDFSKVPLDCIMLTQKLGTLAFLPLGLFPTYCFDREKNSLRLSIDGGSVIVTRNSIGAFRGKSVAVDQNVSIDNVQVIRAHVEKLTGFDVPPGFFSSTTGLVPSNASPAQVPAGTIAGGILKKVPPIDPALAKANHTTGTVIFNAIIGTDGRVHHLTLQSGPDPDLALAAFIAVRQWTYKPYFSTASSPP